MKVKVYLRLARTMRARDGWKVEANTSPNPRPLTMGQGQWAEPLHTLHFALLLTIPEQLLRPAQWPVVEIELPDSVIEQIPEEIEPVAP